MAANAFVCTVCAQRLPSRGRQCRNSDNSSWKCIRCYDRIRDANRPAERKSAAIEPEADERDADGRDLVNPEIAAHEFHQRVTSEAIKRAAKEHVLRQFAAESKSQQQIAGRAGDEQEVAVLVAAAAADGRLICFRCKDDLPSTGRKFQHLVHKGSICQRCSDRLKREDEAAVGGRRLGRQPRTAANPPAGQGVFRPIDDGLSAQDVPGDLPDSPRCLSFFWLVNYSQLMRGPLPTTTRLLEVPHLPRLFSLMTWRDSSNLNQNWQSFGAALCQRHHVIFDMSTDVVLMAFSRTASRTFPLTLSPAVQPELDLIEPWFELRDDPLRAHSTNCVLTDSIQLLWIC